MNIIELYENLKGSYKHYLESFITIKDERIKDKVCDSIKNEELWPKALIQFNPNFAKGIGVKELLPKDFPFIKTWSISLTNHFINISKKLLNWDVKTGNL